jgi:hypothetical protein
VDFIVNFPGPSVEFVKPTIGKGNQADVFVSDKNLSLKLKSSNEKSKNKNKPIFHFE